MKQLHKPPSFSKLPLQPSPKSSSARYSAAFHRPSSSAAAASAHRLLFLLIGFLIASSFFLVLRPLDSLSSLSPSSSATAPRLLRPSPRRLPVGVNKPSLRVVVTGGAGFVGSHLVDRLIERGDTVIVIDNFFTGRKMNLLHHFGNPRFELIRHDVIEPILLEVDQIYHLACPASPVHYKFNPIKTIISFLIA